MLLSDRMCADRKLEYVFLLFAFNEDYMPLIMHVLEKVNGDEHFSINMKPE